MAAKAAGFDNLVLGDMVGYYVVGKSVKIEWYAASGGATATLNVSLKSANPLVGDYVKDLVVKTTASSFDWLIPEELLDRISSSGDINPIVFKLTSYGAQFDNSFNGPNFLQTQSFSNTLWNSSDNNPFLNPTVSNPVFIEQDSVASELNAYVIGKSIITTNYDVQFKHYAKPLVSDSDLTSTYNSSNYKSKGTSSTAITSETVPMLTRLIIDSRRKNILYQQALPSKNIYYPPTTPNLTSDYIAGASDKTNIIWQLARDTDVKFANTSGNFVVIDHQEVGASSWITDSTITAANASSAVGTHTLTIGGLDGEKMYTFRITVLTKYGNVVAKINAQTMKVAMDFLKGGEGVSFGQVAQEKGLSVYMQSHFHDWVIIEKGITGDNNIMSIFPSMTSDYNQLTSTGIHGINAQLDDGTGSSRNRNLPLNVGGDSSELGILEVIDNSPNGIMQRLTLGKVGNNKTYVRSYYNSSWSDWIMIGGTMTTTPKYESGFSDYSDGQKVTISRSGNVVTIIGAVRNANVIKQTGGSSNTTKIFTVPDGMRPLNGQFVSMQASSGMNTFDFIIDASGNAGITRYGTTSNIDMGAGSWINVSCTYICAP